MELHKALGQLLMIGVEGHALNGDEKRFLKKTNASGVIYFRRNVKSPSQLQRLSKSIWNSLDSAPLIAIDQEGGRVARLGAPFTEFPGNDYLGRTYQRQKDLHFVEAQARAMARELKRIGINYNFTPVADIDSNPRNPIIGARSFGGDPKLVGKLVACTVKAYREEAVVSCAKHFPGHGDTSTDSHKVLPVVRAGSQVLSSRELVPFRYAIRAKVPTLMTAHVIYPAWDSKNPATLSRRILDGILRQTLKYRGVVVSDDLEMNAIAKHGDIDAAAELALAAGVDMLLVCKSLERSEDVYRRLLTAFLKSPTLRRRMEESIVRISLMKKAYLRHPFRIATPVTAKGWGGHRALSLKIKEVGQENLLYER